MKPLSDYFAFDKLKSESGKFKSAKLSSYEFESEFNMPESLELSFSKWLLLFVM